MTVLVTDGASALGMRLCARLKEGGQAVKAFLKPHPGDDPDAARLMELGVETCALHLTDKDRLADALAGVTTVYHTAWKSNRMSFSGRGSGARDASDKANIAEMDALIEASETADIKRLVFASSVAVYGPSAEWGPLPRKESDARSDLGDSRNAYFRMYAAAKQRAEAMLRARQSGLEYVILRLALTYGPHTEFPSQMIDSPQTGASGNAQGQKVQWVHLEDAVDALLLAGKVPEAAGNTFNIAGPSTVLTTAIMAYVNRKTGSGARPDNTDWTPRVPKYDTSAAARILGFLPKVDWQEGLSGMNPENDTNARQDALT